MKKVIFQDYCCICADSLTSPEDEPCSKCLAVKFTHNGKPLYFKSNQAVTNFVSPEDENAPPDALNPSGPSDSEGSIKKEEDDNGSTNV